MKRTKQNRCISFSRCNDRGGTLLFVLWIVAFLSALLVAFTAKVVDDIVTQTKESDLNGAIAMAERGVAIGSHAMARNSDPVMRGQFGSNGSFHVEKSRAAARVNPNFLIGSHPGVFEEILVRWGVARPEAQDAVQELADWIDPDDERKLGGSERLFYAQKGVEDHPYNRPFIDLQEMLLVDEFRAVASLIPNWADLFSIYAEGPLDLEYAKARTIETLTGLSSGDVEQFTDYRDGPDSITGSDDDPNLESLENCFLLLNINEHDQSIYSDLLTIGTSVQSVVSRGEFNGIAVEIELTFRYARGGVERLDKSTRRAEHENGRHNMELFPSGR